MKENKTSALFSPNIDASDQEYLLIRDEPRFKSDKQLLEQLWKKYEPYADRNFRIEIARQFHQRFWEMYLTCTLLDLKYEFISKKRGKGPDICLKLEDHKIWIEAVAPKAGEGPDAVPQPKIGKVNLVPEVNWVPEEKVILRYRSVIEEKHRRYLELIEKNILAQSEHYIIAINGRKVPFSHPDDRDMPFIIQAVLPFGQYSVTIDTKSFQIINEGLTYRPGIRKKSGESISTRIFLDEEHKGISGILFSNADILNRPHKSGQEFIFVHNPKAINQLPKGWLTIGNEYWFEEKKLFRKYWK